MKCPIYKVIDPTLLLDAETYEDIAIEPESTDPYILLYSRRCDDRMQQYAEHMAKRNNLKIVEISLNAHNGDHNTMRYDAGIEEFLGLVKNAHIVITNSFHGMIFAIHFRRPFYVFSRSLCNTKISELLDLLEIPERMITKDLPSKLEEINYEKVHNRLNSIRVKSLDTLRNVIENIIV